MQIKKILWASDGSTDSRHALKWAELFASRFGACLSALSVIEIPEIGELESPTDVSRKFARIEDDLVTRAERRLTQAAKILEPRGITMETRVVKGIPHQEILKAAQSHGIDLIAMGKKDLNLWGRMLLGSTTTKVLRETHVPILTVRQVANAPAVKKILVPSSFSPGDTRSLECAFELAGRLGASVYLLHIIEAHESWDKVTGGFMGQLRKLATDKLDSMLQAVPAETRKRVPEFTRVKACRVGSGIVDFVREEDIDLIVMSTHARKGVARLFLGSIAERVIREAPCPVIAVPPSFHSPAQFYIEPSIEGKFKERSPQVVSLPCDQDNVAGPAG
jgi:nucleotide-binding universal stress UspA family protein